MLRKLFIITILSLSSMSLHAAGSSPLQPITQIMPMTYQGEPGFMVSNCLPIGTSCLTNLVGKNPTYFFVPKSHDLYESILSLSITSLVSGNSIQLHGSGACIPACSNGYEIIGSVDFRK